MKRSMRALVGGSLVAFAVGVSAQTPAEPTAPATLVTAATNTVYPIDLPTALRLAGAQNLDVVVVESVNVLDDRTVLTVLCFTNDLVVFDLSSGETVDDSLGSIRASTLVHHIDGRWKSDAPDTLSIVEGPECA